MVKIIMINYSEKINAILLKNKNSYVNNEKLNNIFKKNLKELNY